MPGLLALGTQPRTVPLGDYPLPRPSVFYFNRLLRHFYGPGCLHCGNEECNSCLR